MTSGLLAEVHQIVIASVKALQFTSSYFSYLYREWAADCFRNSLAGSRGS